MCKVTADFNDHCKVHLKASGIQTPDIAWRKDSSLFIVKNSLPVNKILIPADAVPKLWAPSSSHALKGFLEFL